MEHHSAISSLRYAVELRRNRTQFMPVVVKRIAAFVTGYEQVNIEAVLARREVAFVCKSKSSGGLQWC